MTTDAAPSRLERVRDFLVELTGDGVESPAEVQPIVDGYASRLRDSLRRFLAGHIGLRELEAHAIQIRLSYAQDLSKLLAGA